MKEWRNPLLYLFGKGWQYSAKKWLVICFWTMFILAKVVTTLVYPLVLAGIVNTIQAQGIHPENLNHLFLQLLKLLVVIIIFWSLHGPARVMELTNAFDIRASHRKHLISGVMSLPLQWHTDHHSGDTIDKIKKGTDSLYSFSSSSFLIIYGLVKLICSYVMLVYFSHSAAYIVLIMILISIVITMKFDVKIVEQYDRLNEADNKITESIFDKISNITTILTLRVTKHVLSKIYEKIDEPARLQLASNKLNELKWFLAELSCQVMTVTVLGMYFWQISRSSEVVLMGNIFLLIKYLNEIGDLFFQFTSYYGDVLRERRGVANSELLAKEFKVPDLECGFIPSNWSMLSIKNLSFSYTGTDGEHHLDNISLKIKRSQRIAFVGVRGSGKTTALKIMSGLYKPKVMTLEIDGVRIDRGIDGISKSIGLIPQTPELFAETIRDNITFGSEVGEDELRGYTDIACFSEVVDRLPKGFESITKEKGVNFSGGQQQGLALARGMLTHRECDILLMDEPTSSLDRETESRVYSNILGSFPSKTIISTVHGLHLLPLFDRIYVFDKGTIVGEGSITKLVSDCPAFKKLWEAADRV